MSQKLKNTQSLFTIFIFIFISLFSYSTMANNHQHQLKKLTLAPSKLTQQTMVLQIEALTENFAGSSPDQGVIIQTYLNRKHYQTKGIGGLYHIQGKGKYSYHRTSPIRAIEKTEDTLNNMSFTTKYFFKTKKTGSWIRTSADKSIKLSGHFMMSNTHTPDELILAEADHNGLTVAVNILKGESPYIPKEAFPSRALVLQSYQDNGDYSAIAFGPAAVPHSGTYQYDRVSADVAVEQTTQNMENLTATYTMVYHYQTPTSGTWYQNFGNGLIIFSGTFSTFETQE
jgi:hypothetical protein